MDQGVYHNGLYYYGPTVSEFLSTAAVSLSSGINKRSQILTQCTFAVRSRYLEGEIPVDIDIRPSLGAQSGAIAAARDVTCILDEHR